MSEPVSPIAPLQPLPQWQAERALPLAAIVLEKLTGGTYRLESAGSQLLLALPADLKPGDLVNLPARLATVGAPVAPVHEGTDSVEPSLGATARLISRLLSQTDAVTAPPSPEPLAAVAGNARQVAAGLKKAIVTSGLFYESHLAEWVDGAGSKADLLREPQAALPRIEADPARDSESRALPPQAETLVKRQLDTLENRSAYWRGEAWPGQRAEIRVAEDPAARGDRALRRSWQATLKLSMAGLGEVQARLALTGASASITLTATQPAAVDALHSARTALAQALGGRGITTGEVKVGHASLA